MASTILTESCHDCQINGFVIKAMKFDCEIRCDNLSSLNLPTYASAMLAPAVAGNELRVWDSDDRSRDVVEGFSSWEAAQSARILFA